MFVFAYLITHYVGSDYAIDVVKKCKPVTGGYTKLFIFKKLVTRRGREKSFVAKLIH